MLVFVPQAATTAAGATQVLLLLRPCRVAHGAWMKQSNGQQDQGRQTRDGPGATSAHSLTSA